MKTTDSIGPTGPDGDNGSAPHLSEAQLAAYLDLEVDAGERARIEAHLEACSDCRFEVVGARRVLEAWAAEPTAMPLPESAGSSLPDAQAASADPRRLAPAIRSPHAKAVPRRSNRLRLYGLAATALAASIATLLVVRPLARPAVEATDPSRAVQAPYTEGLTSIPVVSPADGSVAAEPVTFIWRAVGASLYHLTLSDAAGALLWTQDSPDTTAVVPSSVRLQAGALYFWNVDGVTEGVTATTKTKRFTIGR